MLDSERVKRIREAMKYSENRFAKSIGVPQTSYYRFERGEGQIYADAIVEIVRLYNIDPEWLLLGVGGVGPIYRKQTPFPSEATAENGMIALSLAEFLEIHRTLMSATTEISSVYKELAEERRIRLLLEEKLRNINDHSPN